MSPPVPEGPSQPRIPVGTLKNVGLVGWSIAWVSGRVAGTGPPNLFLTFGRHRKLFRGWLRFAGRLMPGGTLPRRETELVIIRVAHLKDCRYEFDHHVRLGAKAGVTATDVERLVAGPEADGWTFRERAILRVVDALHYDGDVVDETWEDLTSYLDDKRCIELVFLVGHYEMLATALTTLRVQPDQHRH